MPDITMCLNHDCPSKIKCHRYTVPPSEIQSFAVFKLEKRKLKCNVFIPKKLDTKVVEPDEEGKKTCWTCLLPYPLDEFFNCKAAKDGKSGRCKWCAMYAHRKSKKKQADLKSAAI